jgi:protoheme IX farnesyltransferase
MSSPKAYSEAVVEGGHKTLDAGIGETSAFKDFLALIKIGIVNSNAITTFTGIWLALHFSGLRFLDNLHIVFLTLIGSSLIIAGSCSLNNYIDRDIDHLMERTKGRPTVTGKVEPIKVALLGFLLIGVGSLLLFMTTITATQCGPSGFMSPIRLSEASLALFPH